MLSEDLKMDLEKLIIDEENEHALTKLNKKKINISDHNPLISNFTLKWDMKRKADRIEMFNLKNVDCQAKFKELTNSGTFLSEVFDSKDDINICTNKFIKRLDQIIQKSFKKIRISDRPNKEVEEPLRKEKC